MKSIKLVSRIFSPEVAAATLRLDAVVEALLHRGCAVNVLTTTYERTGSESKGALRISRWPALRDSEGYLRGYVQYASFDVPLLARLLFSRSASAVLVEPPPTTGVMVRIASFLKRVPYVYYAADIWSRAADGTVPSIVSNTLRAIEKFAIRGAAKVVAVNEDVASICRQMGASDVRVVPQGVDTTVFSSSGEVPTPAQKAAIGLGERPYLLYGGNASEVHGAEIFLDAYEQIVDQVDFDLVFFGRGTSWQAFAERSNTGKLRGRVHVNGLIAPGELAKWLRGAKASLASIHPDSGYELAYTTKALSSFSCGTPLLYVGQGPTAQDIRDAHLGVVAGYDAGQVAKAMTTVAAEQWPRQQIRKWTEENKSISSSGMQVAQILLEASKEG